MTAMQPDSVAMTSRRSTRAFPKRAPGRAIMYALPVLLALAIPALALNVANPGLTRGLPPEDLAALDSQGMVAYTTSDSEMFNIYDDASSQELPIFVTTDLPLHAYHVVFDFALRDAERNYFYPSIENLLRGLVVRQMLVTGSSTPQMS